MLEVKIPEKGKEGKNDVRDARRTDQWGRETAEKKRTRPEENAPRD